VKTFTFRESATIPAPATVVYQLIADYRNGHPSILPAKYFGALSVLKGGYGAGTEIAFEMYPFGGKLVATKSRARITEPHPGRVLVETDVERGIATTFTVEPVGRDATWVEFATVLPMRAGLAGRIEKWLVTRLLRSIYVAELAQLARVAHAQSGPGASPALVTAA
jgi:hypothetical protein